jgi:zinc protease
MASDSTGREAKVAIAAAVLVVAIGTIGYGWYQDAAPVSRPVKLEALLPVDPAVRVDTLRNGLVYFVRENARSSGRAELRLLVNAGAVFETDDQRGLAHAVEHMAFRGTKSFRGRKMIDYLESIGTHSSSDVNAHTGRDATTYEINIPTSRPGALDTALIILAEWAHAVTFDSLEAQREAGVVFEEWRFRSHAGRRLQDARDTFLLHGSRYAVRPTIGDTAVLRRFDLGAMRRFYREWYRPELMAVIAVGDFEAAHVETLIRNRFGAIPPSVRPAPRPPVQVALPREARFALLTDDEAASTQVALWFLQPRRPFQTVADYREWLVSELWRSVADDRLSTASEHLLAPLLRASVRTEVIVRPVIAYVLRGTVMKGSLEEGVGMLSEHLTSIAAFGPDATELEEAKEDILSPRSEADAHGVSSNEHADDLTYYFFSRTPALGPEQDYEITKSLLDGITPDDVRDFGRRFSIDSGVALIVSTTTLPDRQAARVGGPALFAAARRGALRASRPVPDTARAPTLLAELPKPGTIVSETFHLDPEAFEWKLSNGMRVLLKQTKHEEAHVDLRLTAPAGAQLASRADYPSAYMADRVLETTGIGPVTGSQLSSIIDRTSIDISPWVSDNWIQLSGTATLSDLNSLFQLTYLFFTAPRTDSVAFARYRERMRLWAAERALDPEEVFSDSVAVAVGRRPPREITSTQPFVEAVDMQRALGFWRTRLRNAANFTAVIVGDVPTARARTLVEQYLASLPGGEQESVQTVPRHERSAPVRRSFRFGSSPQARTLLATRGSVKLDSETNAMLWRVRELLQLSLETRLREVMGATYDVSVGLDVQPLAASTYQYTVSFFADPDRVDSLEAVAIRQVERLRDHGPTLSEFQKIKAAAKSDHERGTESNSFWISELTWHALLGTPLSDIAKHLREIESLTRAELKEAAARYVDIRRYERITMKPALAAPPDVRDR